MSVKSNQHGDGQWMHTVVMSAADAIITIDTDGIIQTVNPATLRMFGYAESELIGQNVKLLMPQPYRDEHDGYLRRYNATGQSHVLGIGREVNARRKNGSIFPVNINVAKVEHLGLFTGILHDISERRELERQVLEIANQEHRTIGQELHDGTQQELTGLSLMAGALKDMLHKVEPPAEDSAEVRVNCAEFARALQIADKLCAGLGEAADRVRRLSHGIMPVQVDPDGLRSALQSFAYQVDQLPGIQCRFESDESVELPDNTTASNFYRIAQEAVNNAMRHAQATEIELSLLNRRGSPCLEIKDNGIGFDVTLTNGQLRKQKDRFGLRIMEYRANAIGGELRIDSQVGQGTRICCSLLRGNGTLPVL